MAILFLSTILATYLCVNYVKDSEMSRSSQHFVEFLVKNGGSSSQRRFPCVTVLACRLLIVTRDRTVSSFVEISLRL